MAVRLAERFWEEGKREEARATLAKCLESSPTSRVVHLHLAKYLIDENARDNYDGIRSHLRASFTEGDTNYDAQFWYARHEFLYGDRAISERIFNHLSKARVSPEFRDKSRAPIVDSSGVVVRFEGQIVGIRDAYCFARVQDLNTNVFIHHSQFDDSNWSRIHINQRLRLSVRFNFRGSVGTEVEVV